MTEERSPVVTLVTNDTRMVSGEVFGLVDHEFTPGKMWRPSKITMTWFDGTLHTVSLAGPILKANGQPYADKREHFITFMAWDANLQGFVLSPQAPQWIVDLVHAHEPRR